MKRWAMFLLPVAVIFAAGTFALPKPVTADDARRLITNADASSALSLSEGTLRDNFENCDFVVSKELTQGGFPKGTARFYLVSTTGVRDWFIVTTKPWNRADVFYLGESFDELEECSVADIGMDCENALIVNLRTIGAGQTGPYHESAIYALDSDGLRMIYRSAYFLDSVNPIDTGFRITLIDQATVVVKNIFTGKEDAVPLDFTIPEGFFDRFISSCENESPFRYVSNRNNFLSFRPADVDNDQISEIVACENCTLSAAGEPYAWNLGKCFVALKYDPSTQMLSVVDSGFWSPGCNTESLEHFAENWYKSP